MANFEPLTDEQVEKLQDVFTLMYHRGLCYADGLRDSVKHADEHLDDLFTELDDKYQAGFVEWFKLFRVGRRWP